MMPYLTFSEFDELTGKATDVTEEEFNKLLPKSSDVLDNATSYFYCKNDIGEDMPWRAKQFKKALCAQIQYFKSMGGTSFEEINSTPQTFSAGRTSVSNASRYNSGGRNESKPMAEDVKIYLSGTGLLYAGIGVIE